MHPCARSCRALARCARAWAVLPLLAAAVPATAGEPAPDVSIALRFAWPDGLRGTRASHRETGGELLGVKLDETRTVLGSRRGVDYVLASTTGGEYRRGSPTLTLVVAPDGSFRGLEGLATARKRLEATTRKDTPGLTPEMREQMASSLVQLASTMESFAWYAAVERWSGKELVLGRTYQDTETPPERTRARPGRPERVEWGARRRVACEEGAPAGGCVELWARGETDPETFRRECDPPPGSLRFLEEPARERWTLELVTEPETLVPRHLAWTWSTEAGCGRPAALQRGTDEWTITWRWER
jgi:hypothetical protein